MRKSNTQKHAKRAVINYIKRKAQQAKKNQKKNKKNKK
jgi:hypothetical protein